MFTISSIVEKAQQFLRKTPGVFQIALIPVFVSAFVQLVSTSRQTIYELILSGDVDLHLSYLLSSMLFPFLYGLLTGLLHLSILWTIVRLIKQTALNWGVGSAVSIFHHPQFKHILFTFLAKKFFLFLWSLLLYVGPLLILGSIVWFNNLALGADGQFSGQLPPNSLFLLTLGFLVGLGLLFVGLAIYIPQVYAYAQVELILFDSLEQDRYPGALAIIRSSRRLMKGYKFKQFVLDLRFIGWFILGILTFDLTGLYVWPYYYAARVYAYQAILKEKTPLATDPKTS